MKKAMELIALARKLETSLQTVSDPAIQARVRKEVERVWAVLHLGVDNLKLGPRVAGFAYITVIEEPTIELNTEDFKRVG